MIKVDYDFYTNHFYAHFISLYEIFKPTFHWAPSDRQENVAGASNHP